MAGFEDVIQRALEKNQSASPEMREQVYYSARTALAGMLEKSGRLSPENIRNQRQNLETAIANIEAGYIALEYDAQAVNEVPSLEAEQFQYNESGIGEPANGDPGARRRPFAKLLLVTTFLAAIGIVGWLIYDQELTRPAWMRDNSVPNPPKILVDEGSNDIVQDKKPTGWITIFEPGDPRSLITEGAVSAELAKDDIGAYIRLKKEQGSENGSIKLLVEPGVMESIQGKAVTVEMKIKSGDSSQQQFVITCEFRELGNCGRKRFTVGTRAELFVFKTILKDQSISGAEKSGFISIDTDISNNGRPIDLYLVRVNAE